jgi:hypothetical protein
MSKIYHTAFTRVADEEMEKETLLWNKVLKLQFIQPCHLDLVDNFYDLVVQLSGDELRKVNNFATPASKLQCIVKSCSILFNFLNMQRDFLHDSKAGADDFMPLFILSVVKAKVPYLLANSNFIAKYHQSRKLVSQEGYCLTNLSGALEFLVNAGPSSFTMPLEEYKRYISDTTASSIVPSLSKFLATNTSLVASDHFSS